jgi:phthalate 4,5-dioxygenase
VLTREESELLTRVGPGTPGGAMLRRYWQPAALAEEIPPGGAPVPIRLLGEDLVLFRDDHDRLGLLGLHCAHRGADLSYGRCEDGGLRCLYHGWLYDVEGRCLEQPGEPAGSTFHQRIRHTAYPCLEAAGIVFAYLGPGAPPLLPAYEALTAPPDHVAVLKLLHECSYLQGNEGNIDPVHLSFLHAQFGEEDEYERRWQHGVRGAESANPLYRQDTSPTLEAEETDFGVRIYSIRRASPTEQYVRISNFVMPDLSAIPAGTGADGYGLNWAIPIDDTHHWKYQLAFQRSRPINREAFEQRRRAGIGPDYRPFRNQANRYLQDRAEMRTQSFSGMGSFFPAHDTFATEGEGPVQDHTQEHLGSTDLAIALSRRMLLRAIRDVQEGRDPPHVVRATAANDFAHLVVRSEIVPASEDWRTYWRKSPVSVGEA